MGKNKRKGRRMRKQNIASERDNLLMFGTERKKNGHVVHYSSAGKASLNWTWTKKDLFSLQTKWPLQALVFDSVNPNTAGGVIFRLRTASTVLTKGKWRIKVVLLLYFFNGVGRKKTTSARRSNPFFFCLGLSFKQIDRQNKLISLSYFFCFEDKDKKILKNKQQLWNIMHTKQKLERKKVKKSMDFQKSKNKVLTKKQTPFETS